MLPVPDAIGDGFVDQVQPMPAVQAERLVWLRVAHGAAAARAGVYLGSHSLRHFAFPPDS